MQVNRFYSMQVTALSKKLLKSALSVEAVWRPAITHCIFHCSTLCGLSVKTMRQERELILYKVMEVLQSYYFIRQ